MKSIRFLGALALSAGVAGCAGNPASVPTASIDPPDVETSNADLSGLPDRIAEAPEPVETVPVTPQAIDLGAYESEPIAAAPLEYVEQQPEVAVETVAYQPAPVQPTYTLQSPGFVAEARPLARGQMAPVRDDPIDTASRSTPRATTYNVAALKAAYQPKEALSVSAPPPRVRNAHTPEFGNQLSQSALSRLNPNVAYVAAYKKIGYPWGDVSEDTGVCTDVVIRSYRGLGIDLQSMVHEDMRQAFSAYPSKKIYGLTKADPNIDHRRVVNLEAFFERVGASIPLGSNYQPGDVITWRLSGGEPHIGVVVNRTDPKTGNPLIVHNLGAGVRAEDLLDYATPHGAYRFGPDQFGLSNAQAVEKERFQSSLRHSEIRFTGFSGDSLNLSTEIRVVLGGGPNRKYQMRSIHRRNPARVHPSLDDGCLLAHKTVNLAIKCRF